MKLSVYIYLYYDNTDAYGPQAISDVVMDKEEAVARMRKSFSEALSSLGIKEGFRDDDHSAEIDGESAYICWGMDTYNWEIVERSIDVNI